MTAIIASQRPLVLVDVDHRVRVVVDVDPNYWGSAEMKLLTAEFRVALLGDMVAAMVNSSERTRAVLSLL